MTTSRANTATNISLIAVFAALIAVCSIIPGFNVGPVPITLQTFAVMLSGAVLGAWRGSLAVLLYLAVGFAGLPVFAGATGGPAVFMKPSIGYLLAFPLAAWLIGFIVERLPRKTTGLYAGMVFIAALLASVVFIWPMGILGMWWRVPFESFGQGFVANLAFVPGDLIKTALVAIVAAAVHRAFPTLLASRPRATGDATSA